MIWFDLVYCAGCISPSLKRINVQENAHFECLSDTKVSWIFNGGPIMSYAITFGNLSSNLMVENSKPGHSGQYACIGTMNDGELQYFANAELQVWGNLAIYH